MTTTEEFTINESDLASILAVWSATVPALDPAYLVDQRVVDGAIVITTTMPGLDPERDLDVWIEDGVAHIEATRTERFVHRDRYGCRSEMRRSHLSRLVPLPGASYHGSVRTSYADDVLCITIRGEL